MSQPAPAISQLTSTVARAVLPLPAWQVLIDQLHHDDPDVVVLVARKMPRVAELLGVHFSARTSVIADVALPFCQSILKCSRVAIVDDIVNVGSTVKRAAELAIAAGAASVKIYSLGHRSGLPTNDDQIEMFYALKGTFSENQYRSHVRSIPAAISQLAKPFDLAFPVIPCAYPLGISKGEDLARLLVTRFGDEQVQVIPSPYHNSPVRRITLWPDDDPNRKDRKLRIYFDDAEQICRLVPIAVQQPIPPGEGTRDSNPIWNMLRAEVEVFQGLPESTKLDAMASIAVFQGSLAWFVSSAASKLLGPILRPLFVDLIDLSDAALLFGPLVQKLTERAEFWSKRPRIPRLVVVVRSSANRRFCRISTFLECSRSQGSKCTKTAPRKVGWSSTFSRG